MLMYKSSKFIHIFSTVLMFFPFFFIWSMPDSKAAAFCNDPVLGNIVVTINPALAASGIPCATTMIINAPDLQILNQAFINSANAVSASSVAAATLSASAVSSLVNPADVNNVFVWGFGAVAYFASLGIAIGTVLSTIKKA